MLTRAQVIREALKEVESPQTTPLDRILAIARIKYSQSGGDPASIENRHISGHKYQIKALYGKVTKETIKKYEQRSDVGAYYFQNVRQTHTAENGNSAPITQTARSEDSANQTLSQLAKTKNFAKEIGSIDEAIRMLNLLKEVQLT